MKGVLDIFARALPKAPVVERRKREIERPEELVKCFGFALNHPVMRGTLEMLDRLEEECVETAASPEEGAESRLHALTAVWTVRELRRRLLGYQRLAMQEIEQVAKGK